MEAIKKILQKSLKKMTRGLQFSLRVGKDNFGRDHIESDRRGKIIARWTIEGGILGCVVLTSLIITSLAV